MRDASWIEMDRGSRKSRRISAISAVWCVCVCVCVCVCATERGLDGRIFVHSGMFNSYT
jgi:hypothetical protein